MELREPNLEAQVMLKVDRKMQLWEQRRSITEIQARLQRKKKRIQALLRMMKEWMPSIEVGLFCWGSWTPFAKNDLTKLTTTTSFFYLIDVFAR